MAETVWCVFQRLGGEGCPTLAAVCASRAAAERIVALGGEGGDWTIGAWSVVREEGGEMEEIEEIGMMSDALDPWRAGAQPPEGEGEGRSATGT